MSASVTWRASTLRHSSRFIMAAPFKILVRVVRVGRNKRSAWRDGLADYADANPPLRRLRRPSADQQHHRPALRIGVVDGGPDLRHIGLLFDLVIGDAHGLKDGLDDTHAIELGLPWRASRLLLQQANHHATRPGVCPPDAPHPLD